MIYIYSENNKNAEKIAGEIETGLKIVAEFEVKQTKNIKDAGESDLLIVCIAKKNLGIQLPNAAELNTKNIYIAGAGLNLKEIERLRQELNQRNVSITNSICLRRKALLAGVMEENLKEEELARARAFGERIGLTLTGQRARQKNEKNRIKNYIQ